MRWQPVLTFALCGLLAGCGNFGTSNLNPFNWFGGGRSEEVRADPGALPADPRPLIDQITNVATEDAPGGIIVRATGLPPTLGYWSAALVPAGREAGPDENGELVLDFRVLPPPTPEPEGVAAARRIVAGYFLSDQTLVGVRSVTVRGDRNARSVRP